MKALLIEDPEYCGECILYNFRKHCCIVAGEGDCRGDERIQENCPLLPVPELVVDYLQKK